MVPVVPVEVVPVELVPVEVVPVEVVPAEVEDPEDPLHEQLASWARSAQIWFAISFMNANMSTPCTLSVPATDSSPATDASPWNFELEFGSV